MRSPDSAPRWALKHAPYRTQSTKDTRRCAVRKCAARPDLRPIPTAAKSRRALRTALDVARVCVCVTGAVRPERQRWRRECRRDCQPCMHASVTEIAQPPQGVRGARRAAPRSWTPRVGGSACAKEVLSRVGHVEEAVLIAMLIVDRLQRRHRRREGARRDKEEDRLLWRELDTLREESRVGGWCEQWYGQACLPKRTREHAPFGSHT